MSPASSRFLPALLAAQAAFLRSEALGLSPVGRSVLLAQFRCPSRRVRREMRRPHLSCLAIPKAYKLDKAHPFRRPTAEVTPPPSLSRAVSMCGSMAARCRCGCDGLRHGNSSGQILHRRLLLARAWCPRWTHLVHRRGDGASRRRRRRRCRRGRRERGRRNGATTCRHASSPPWEGSGCERANRRALGAGLGDLSPGEEALPSPRCSASKNFLGVVWQATKRQSASRRINCQVYRVVAGCGGAGSKRLSV